VNAFTLSRRRDDMPAGAARLMVGWGTASLVFVPPCFWPGSVRADCDVSFVDLPVIMSGPTPLIAAKINHVDVNLVLDSGAFFSMLTPAAAEQFKLPQRPRPDGLAVDGIGGRTSVSLTRVNEFTLTQTSFQRSNSSSVAMNPAPMRWVCWVRTSWAWRHRVRPGQRCGPDGLPRRGLRQAPTRVLGRIEAVLGNRTRSAGPQTQQEDRQRGPHQWRPSPCRVRHRGDDIRAVLAGGEAGGTGSGRGRHGPRGQGIGRGAQGS